MVWGDHLRGRVPDELLDPTEYVPRMPIRDKRGRKTTLFSCHPEYTGPDPRPEQWSLLNALASSNRVAVLKPRQIGTTTLVTAFLNHRITLSQHPYNVLCVGHEDRSAKNTISMHRMHHEGMPPVWRCQLARPTNAHEITFARPGQEEADWSHVVSVVAGGRSQGRGYTYRAVHFTEMGLYPRGSSATKGTDTAADEDAYGSILSTIEEDEDTRVIVESTADGPGGIFHKICTEAARSDSDWNFQFFRWFEFSSYERNPGVGFELEDHELEDAELIEDWLRSRHPFATDAWVSLRVRRKIAWRRWKLLEYTETRFRREYPRNFKDPFRLSGNSWFDVEALTRQYDHMGPTLHVQDVPGFHVFEPPEDDRQYFVGVDASAGVGKDWAVIQVVSDDLRQVAVYRDKYTGPTALARRVWQISSAYGEALVLAEKNKMGKVLVRELEKLHVRQWKDAAGRYWHTSGSHGAHSKEGLLEHARVMLDQGFCLLFDPTTANEAERVRMQKSGRIEADEGYHDDHVMSLAFALWCAKRVRRAKRAMTDYERRRRMRDARRLAG